MASITQRSPQTAFPRRIWPRLAFIALIAYVIYASAQMEISWERVEIGLGNAHRFFSRLFPPNFARWDLLVKGLVESLQIAVLASVLGIVLALPIGLFAARNLMPPWVSLSRRSPNILKCSCRVLLAGQVDCILIDFGAGACACAPKATASMEATAMRFMDSLPL